MHNESEFEEDDVREMYFIVSGSNDEVSEFVRLFLDLGREGAGSLKPQVVLLRPMRDYWLKRQWWNNILDSGEIWLVDYVGGEATFVWDIWADIDPVPMFEAFPSLSLCWSGLRWTLSPTEIEEQGDSVGRRAPSLGPLVVKKYTR